MSDIVEIDLALQGGGAHGAVTWGCWTVYSTNEAYSMLLSVEQAQDR